VTATDDPGRPTEPAGFVDRLELDDARALDALGRSRSYPAKSVLFFEGDDAHEVLIVRSGHVKVSGSSDDGKEVVLDVVGSNHILGELSALDGQARSATVTALTRTSVTAISNDQFRAFIVERPVVALELVHDLTARLRGASRRQVEFGAIDGLGRVCRRLVDLMERYGEPGADGTVITAPLSQQEIGAWAGLSREAVVKSLQGMRSLGWITVQRRTITIRDPESVRGRAGFSHE
jgi:CRP-like cAMP-binding protein